MATGHRNPGYGGLVSRFRDVRDKGCRGYAGSQGLKDMMDLPQDSGVLDDIRRQAMEAWSKHDTNETSYQDHYRERFDDVVEPTTARPTSATRKNKPHPPMVFLTTRLHSVPGYHNADTTMGKDAYKVDASLPPHMREERTRFRDKYQPRPCSGAVNQFKTMEELDAIGDPIERQGTEAWMKISMDKDKENVLAHLKEVRGSDAYKFRGAVERSQRPRTVPSLHRYLKEAGYGEQQTLDDLYNRHHNQGIKEIYPETRGRTPVDIVTMRMQDIDNTRSSRYIHRPKRGDFLLHPQWPPTIPHHRLNGLSRRDQTFSSTEIPYMPGRTVSY